jgi:gluconokinase
MVRAALEGVAYMLKMVLEAIRDNGLDPDSIRIGGGGSRSSLWMDIISSVLGVPLQVSKMDEPALVGSAVLGFTALGRYRNMQEATEAMVQVDRTYEPDTAAADRYNSDYEFYKYLVGSVGEAFRHHGSCRRRR